jgi:hypothetical protein
VLDPIRQQLGLEKLNFQILRRTYATRAIGERKGTLKDVQKQLRHARPDTTLENYVKDIPESVYAMTDSMYEMISPSVTIGPTTRKGERAMTSIDHVLNTGVKEAICKLLKSGAPGEIRTPDLLLRRQSLYPTELRAHSNTISLHVQVAPFNARAGGAQQELLRRTILE